MSVTAANGVAHPGTNYVESAVAAECAKVVNAAPKQANDTLHKASVALGTMEGAGWADRAMLEGRLEEAAAQRCNNITEARATIKSGLDWGRSNPREASADDGFRIRDRQAGIKADNRVRAHRLWQGATSIEGTSAAIYLSKRGLGGPWPTSLRFSSSVIMQGEGTYPAMVAGVTVPSTGELIAVQRTALRHDGVGKAEIAKPKAALGATAGGAVVFGNLLDGAAILEGEGIETVLSACQASGLPGIATLSAGTLGKPLLPSNKPVIVLADKGSEAAAEAGAERRLKEGRAVKIALPSHGKDFNDTLVAAGSVAVKTCIDHAIAAKLKPQIKTYSARCLADISPERVHWLWEGQFAKGKLSLIAGHPGRGKSQLTLAVAALVSTGGDWPDGATCAAGNVVLVSCEDEQSDTVVPRLMALGADLKRCHVLDAVRDEHGKERPFSLKAGIGALTKMLDDLNDVALVIIDPISAYLDGIDSHKNADMRGALVPLQALAEKYKASVLMISHFNKGTADGLALSRVSGSGALGAVCRSCWMVERDPDDPTGEARFLVPMKNNIGNDRYGFAFQLEGCQVADGIATSRIRFRPGKILVSADTLAASSKGKDEQPSSCEAAISFLQDELTGGPKAQADVIEAGKKAGHAKRTLERAKRELNVRSQKIGSAWLWSLPEQPKKHWQDDLDEREDRQDRQDFEVRRAGGHELDERCIPNAHQLRQELTGQINGGLGGVGGLDADALSDAFRGA